MRYKKLNILLVVLGVGALLFAVSSTSTRADYCDYCSDDSTVYDGGFDYSQSPESSTYDPNEYDTYQYDTYNSLPSSQDVVITPTYDATAYDQVLDKPAEQTLEDYYSSPDLSQGFGSNAYEVFSSDNTTGNSSDADLYSQGNIYTSSPFGNQTSSNNSSGSDVTNYLLYGVPPGTGPAPVNIKDYIDPVTMALGYNDSPITFNYSNGTFGVSYGGYGADLGYADTGNTSGSLGAANFGANNDYLANGIPSFNSLVPPAPTASQPRPDPIILPTYKGTQIRTQDIKPSLTNIYLTSAKALGIGMIAIVSAGQPSTGNYSAGCDQDAAGSIVRCGARQHDNGNAGDIVLYKDGHALNFDNLSDRAIVSQFITLSVAQGATGIGAGDGYMGPLIIHVGYGTPAGYWGGGVVDPHPAPQWLIEAYDKGIEMQTAQNKEVQQVLAAQHYYNGPIDGIVGPQTESALAAFQKANGLPADGTVSPGTLAALDVLPPGGQPIQVANNVSSNTAGTPSSHTVSAATATEVQQILAAQHYYNGPIDGIVGSQTESALKAFQKANGLPADGTVSPVTIAALDNAVLANILSTPSNTSTPPPIAYVQVPLPSVPTPSTPTETVANVPLPHLRSGNYVISNQGEAIPVASQTTGGVPLPNLRPGSTVPTPNLSPCDTGAAGCPTLQPGDVFQVTDQGQVIPLPHLRPGDVVPLPNLRPGDTTQTTSGGTSGESSGYTNLIIPLLFMNISIPIPIPKSSSSIVYETPGVVVPTPRLREDLPPGSIPTSGSEGGTVAQNESTTIPRGPYGSEVLARAILSGDPDRIAAAQKQVEDNANAEIQASCGGKILCLLSLKGNEENLKAQATAQVQVYLTQTLPEEAPGAVRQFQTLVQNNPSIISDLPADQRQLLDRAFSNLPPLSGATQTQSSGSQTSGSGSDVLTNVPLPNLRPGDIGSTITLGYYGEDEEVSPSNFTVFNSVGNSVPSYSYFFSPNTLLETSNTAPTYAPPAIPLYFSLDQDAQLSDAYVYQPSSTQDSYFSGFSSPSSDLGSGSPVFLDTAHLLELYRNSGSPELSNVWRTSVVITKDPTTGEYRIANTLPNPEDHAQTPTSLDISNILPLYQFVTQPGSSVVTQNWNLINSRYGTLFGQRNSDHNELNNTPGATYTDTSFNLSTSDTPPPLKACSNNILPSASTHCSFNFASALVRQNYVTKIYWYVSAIESGDVCTITSAPNVTEMPSGGLHSTGRGTWANNAGFSVTISQKTDFTLKCTTAGGVSSSITKTVNITPDVKEI